MNYIERKGFKKFMNISNFIIWKCLNNPDSQKIFDDDLFYNTQNIEISFNPKRIFFLINSDEFDLLFQNYINIYGIVDGIDYKLVNKIYRVNENHFILENDKFYIYDLKNGLFYLKRKLDIRKLK
jgi:hypothetical protein